MRDEQFKADVRAVLETEQGIRVFRQLVKDFGYQKTSLVLSTTGEVAINSTLNNEAIRAFWCNLREFIPQEKLVLIEYDSILEVEKCQQRQQEQLQQQVRQLPPHRISARRTQQQIQEQ